MGVKFFIRGMILACGALTTKWLHDRCMEEHEERDVFLE